MCSIVIKGDVLISGGFHCTCMYMYTANDLFNHSVKGAEQLEGPNFWKCGRERILEASNFTVGSSHHYQQFTEHSRWYALVHTTDIDHMTSPRQCCTSMHIVWQNGVSDTPNLKVRWPNPPLSLCTCNCHDNTKLASHGPVRYKMETQWAVQVTEYS